VTEESVSSIDDILEKLKKGELNRHYAQTMMNHTSSRSHTIFRLMVQTVTNTFIRDYRREQNGSISNINNFDLKSQAEISQDSFEGAQGTVVTESLLNFVDLAGSEKVSNHQVVLEDGNVGTINTMEHGGIYGKDSILAASKLKDRIKEGQHINKSLFFLTQVISLKSEGKNNQHIPYRNSPLTKILRSSLGGNSRTLVILCVTPAGSQYEQTLSTIRFGMNAKKIENKVQANIVTNDEGEAFRILISDYERKLKDLENTRLEDHYRNQVLQKQVEDLQAQKASLVDRVNSLCKLQLGRMAEKLPEDTVSTFFKQAKERLIHFDKIGILFSSTKSLKKYETGQASEKKDRKGLNSSTILDCSVDEDLEDDDQVCRCGKASSGFGKSKANEMMSQYSMAGLKLAKQQISLLQKKITILQGNFGELMKRDLENYQNYLNMVSKRESDRKAFTKKYESTRDKLIKKCQDTRTNLRNLSLNFNGKMDEMNDLQIQLNLYRDMHGITELTDFNLAELENHLWAKVDDIKVEKARRVVHKQTGAFPPVQSAFIRTQNDPVPIPSDDEIWNSSDDTDTSSNQDLKDLRSIDDEAELFKGLFKRGLDDVEVQLEEVKKLNLDIDRDGQHKEKKPQNHKKDKESISLKDIPKSAQKKAKETPSSGLGSRNGARGLRSSCGQLDFKLDLINNVPENFNEQDLNKYKNIKKIPPTQVRQDKGKDTLISSRLGSKERVDVKEEPTRDTRNRPDVSPDVVSSSKFSTRILEESMIKLNETTKEVTLKNLLKDVKIAESNLMRNNKVNSAAVGGVKKTTSASKMALDAAKDKLQKSATSKLISSRIASTERSEYQRDNLSGNKKTSSSAKKEEVGLTRIQKMLLLEGGGDTRGRNDVSQNLSFKRSATNSGAKSVDKSNNKRKKETENVKTEGEEKERAELAMYQRQLNNREDISVSDFRTSINIQEGIREHSEENYSCQDREEEANNKTSLEISHLEDLPMRNSKDMTPTYSPYYTQRDGEVTIANMTAIKFYDTVSQISEMNGYLSSEFRKSHHNQSMEGDDYTMSELNQTMGDETKRRRSRADRQKRRRVENEI